MDPEVRASGEELGVDWQVTLEAGEYVAWVEGEHLADHSDFDDAVYDAKSAARDRACYD